MQSVRRSSSLRKISSAENPTETLATQATARESQLIHTQIESDRNRGPAHRQGAKAKSAENQRHLHLNHCCKNNDNFFFYISSGGSERTVLITAMAVF